MRFFLALALLVAASVASPYATQYWAPNNRAGCPPEGYVAIFAHTNLARLPANGKYAICQTADQAAQFMEQIVGNGPNDNELTFEFNTTSVWKMTNSRLIVDNNMRINVNYPSRLDWNNVVVTSFAEEDRLNDGAMVPAFADGKWRGIQLVGAFVNDDHHSHVELGNCGSLNHVRVDGVADDINDLYVMSITNCTSKTLMKDVSVHNAGGGFFFQDVYGLIAYDLTAAAGGQGYEGVEIDRSQMALIRPEIFSGNDEGIAITDGSYVTLCDAFISAEDAKVELGESDITGGEPVAVAVAGLTNLNFPDDVSFRATGGILYTLADCPSKIKATYDMGEWLAFYTM